MNCYTNVNQEEPHQTKSLDVLVQRSASQPPGIKILVTIILMPGRKLSTDHRTDLHIVYDVWMWSRLFITFQIKIPKEEEKGKKCTLVSKI